ncbi:ester cyclase [Streptomyces sp. enrichment culture]|uniref:ester cyclase n=1 Tax=Streptomyces sp. enrichment culture TaxID=1795815 RepID=UPI003F57EAB2
MFRARRTGPWSGVLPSGRQVEFRVMDLVRHREGQVAGHWAAPVLHRGALASTHRTHRQPELFPWRRPWVEEAVEGKAPHVRVFGKAAVVAPVAALSAGSAPLRCRAGVERVPAALT